MAAPELMPNSARASRRCGRIGRQGAHGYVAVRTAQQPAGRKKRSLRHITGLATEDPEHRLVVSVVPGERTAESVQELVTDVKERLDGQVPELITTDESTASEGAILEAFGTEMVPPRTGKPGRPRKAFKVAPAELHYATVHKARKKGRVVDVVRRVIFGTAASVEAALADSEVSRTVNTSFVERHNGTDRNRNARKVRKTYCFSKDWWVHRAVTFFTMSSDNFC